MATTEAQNQILLLLDRPNEPIFTPKGDKGVVYNIPDDYLESRFQGNDISNRFGQNSERIPIKPINLPDLQIPKQLEKEKPFSLFIPNHRRYAAKLIDEFMGMKSLPDLLSCAAYCRENLNKQLFHYALSVAILHRDDMKNVTVPALYNYFPDKFVESRVLKEAREAAVIQNKVNTITPTPIEIPIEFTATDVDVEHRLAYFREDIALSLFHWHWHLVYPFEGPDRVVNKDRRGEIFYYMHQQLIARYNFERFCNKLTRVEKLSKWSEPMKEGYFPKLSTLISSRVWPARQPNEVLKNINRPSEGLVFDIQTLDRWRTRLYEAIHTGFITDTQGNTIRLTEETGIDILGNLMEASQLSLNRNLYGDMHNLGHMAIALVHDPDNRYLENINIMGDNSMNTRDPIFYRWHALVDEMFGEYKQTLPQYRVNQLDFNGVEVLGIQVTSLNYPNNQLTTFWQKSQVNLTRGLDFAPRSNVFTRFTHLQNSPFNYQIPVNNNGAERRGTVRIYLAPKFDERGLPLRFIEQRLLMIELDKFVVDLKPGRNNITRSSQDSSVTIPFETSFRDLNTAPTSGTALAEFNFCGCGWPQHMLIPKGTTEGFETVLFVMISNYEDDRVDGPGSRSSKCKDAVSYCGLVNSKYPDRRAMGYPFDRLPRPGADTIQRFLTPNMAIQDVTIQHIPRVLQSS